MIASTDFLCGSLQTDIFISPVDSTNMLFVDTTDEMDFSRHSNFQNLEYRTWQLTENLDSTLGNSIDSLEDLRSEIHSISPSRALISTGEMFENPILGSFEPCLDVNVDIEVEENMQNSPSVRSSNQNSDTLSTSASEIFSRSFEDTKSDEYNLENSAEFSWDLLPSTAQLSIVQDLIDIISTQLGLREQLEVLRIINPNSPINPTDKELFIDIEDLNEDKMRRVRTYIQRTQHNGANSDVTESSSSRSSSPVSELFSDNGRSPPPPAQKKRTRKRQSKETLKLEKQRLKKLSKQKAKELESGLFKSEQILSLLKQGNSHNPPPDEEVDILF